MYLFSEYQCCEVLRGRKEKCYRPKHKTVIHEIIAKIRADSITVKRGNYSFTKYSQLVGYPLVGVQYGYVL